MALDVRRARAALRAAGESGGAVSGGLWPFGRERRLRSKMRRRLAVLQAKNNVVDLLFRTQRPLEEFRLSSVADVEAALKDPEKRRRIVTLGASRPVLEDDLRTRYGTELGAALDQALAELVGEEVLLRIAGEVMLSNEAVYLAVLGKGRPHYETGELNRLLQESRAYGGTLRARARKRSSTDSERSYDL